MIYNYWYGEIDKKIFDIRYCILCERTQEEEYWYPASVSFTFIIKTSNKHFSLRDECLVKNFLELIDNL